MKTTNVGNYAISPIGFVMKPSIDGPDYQVSEYEVRIEPITRRKFNQLKNIVNVYYYRDISCVTNGKLSKYQEFIIQSPSMEFAIEKIESLGITILTR